MYSRHKKRRILPFRHSCKGVNLEFRNLTTGILDFRFLVRHGIPRYVIISVLYIHVISITADQIRVSVNTKSTLYTQIRKHHARAALARHIPAAHAKCCSIHARNVSKCIPSCNKYCKTINSLQDHAPPKSAKTTPAPRLLGKNPQLMLNAARFTLATSQSAYRLAINTAKQ